MKQVNIEEIFYLDFVNKGGKKVFLAKKRITHDTFILSDKDFVKKDLEATQNIDFEEYCKLLALAKKCGLRRNDYGFYLRFKDNEYKDSLNKFINFFKIIYGEKNV